MGYQLTAIVGYSRWGIGYGMIKKVEGLRFKVKNSKVNKINQID